MKVSIILTTYNRHEQLARTLRSIIGQGYDADSAYGNHLELILVDDNDGTNPASDEATRQLGRCCDQYIPLRRPRSASFRNPSLANNIGIRAATGDVVILQNAECEHIFAYTIESLVSQVTSASATQPTAVFAHVLALSQQGNPFMCYCGPENPRPYFFCGAIHREHLVRLRGFDEDFRGAGYDDDDLASRLRREGIRFLFPESPLVHHQWHPPAGSYDDVEQMRQLFERKQLAMDRGELGTVRNLNREWGQVPAAQVPSEQPEVSA